MTPNDVQGSSRPAQIVTAALALLETDGPEGVTMRAIADRLGIRAPSLYKHFPDKEALETAIIAAGFRDQANSFAAAVDGTDDPLADLGVAYREWARRRPHLYRLMTSRPIRRDLLPAGVEAAAAAPLLHAVDGDVARARAAWGLAHGLASLELAERFPADADIDAAWHTGINALGTTHTTTNRKAQP